MTVFDQPSHDIAGKVCRDSETDALVAAAAAQDRGIDADQPAIRIHERATGVTRIDRGIRLNEVLVIEPDRARAPRRADDSGRYRLADAKRVPDCEYYVPHLHLVTVCHRKGG